MTIKFTKYGKNVALPITINIPNLEKFRAEFIDFGHRNSPEKSEKASSYANYIEYLIQNYYDNYTFLIAYRQGLLVGAGWFAQTTKDPVLTGSKEGSG